MFKLKFALAFLTAAVTAVAAGEITGKWTAEMPGRGGNPMTVTMNLKADGDKLTGSVSNPRGDSEITDGKIEGENVTFNIVREFNDNKMVQAYKGKMDGDTIHFAVTMSGGPMGNMPAREFDAKRAK